MGPKVTCRHIVYGPLKKDRERLAKASEARLARLAEKIKANLEVAKALKNWDE